MSCLLPQFKCQPDTFSINFRTHHSRHKEPICFQAQCLLSTTSLSTLTATTAMLDVEKLRLPIFEAHPSSVVADREQTYIEASGSPSEACFGTTLGTENLTSDEAVIAAAAAEAVALARAAVEVSKDVALMFKNYGSSETEIKSATDTSTSKWALFTEAERAGIIGDGLKEDRELEENYSERNSTKESVELEELELLEEQLSRSIAVRSKRQPDRKARRTRAAEKAAANVASVKSSSTDEKRHGALRHVVSSDPLRNLRRTNGTSRLLTANEELELSEGIQDLLKLERLQEELADRSGGLPTFAELAAAAGVDQKTLRRRLNYGKLCKEKMIKSNIRLVISIAKNYQGTGMNFQDLVQEGCRGLIRGTEKFDASRGFKFSTYAHWWIKQAVRKFLSEQSRTIRLPFHMVEATYRVKEARKQLYSENGRQPNNKEVAEASGLSMKKLTTVLLTPKAPQSLDQKIGIYQNLKPSEVIADPEADTSEDILIKQLMKKDIEKLLESLSPRERQVVRWRFGMEDGRMKTLQEIGELMGVSRERIRQIESCAFRKLKNKTRARHLQQYLISYGS
ncbi:RNApolymerase sigma subunit 2, SIGMA FACTOR 1, SIGMA FACTOR 2, SIGMA FACTOR B [Hibiscus trionum]|uniref:RNA polymerase sigma factor n=1 Tax=Hibiscus trionum TaxID=183268 RepID=A0A9W7M602_HIBTR|nr:RNApolymerase sigma subunit 2, SIGMA FACTOR 1, SIGMA FACTOR 2, SIGMA FACTOR B [Hibiscus trionum]